MLSVITYLILYLWSEAFCWMRCNRTRHRKLTFFDGSAETPMKCVGYTPMAQPYCSELREVTVSLQHADWCILLSIDPECRFMNAFRDLTRFFWSGDKKGMRPVRAGRAKLQVTSPLPEVVIWLEALHVSELRLSAPPSASSLSAANYRMAVLALVS